jgi:uncharacterized membrane protein
MQAQYLIEMADAVVVTRDAEGAVQLHQAVNLVGASAMGGAILGVAHRTAVPQPAARRRRGRGLGSGVGKLADIGINDKFMKDLSATLTPGSAALFVLVRKSTPDKVLDGLKAFAGKGGADKPR